MNGDYSSNRLEYLKLRYYVKSIEGIRPAHGEGDWRRKKEGRMNDGICWHEANNI
jgi:GH43 family beta-xylosidase